MLRFLFSIFTSIFGGEQKRYHTPIYPRQEFERDFTGPVQEKEEPKKPDTVNPKLKKGAPRIGYKRIYWHKLDKKTQKRYLNNLTLREEGGCSSIEGTLTDGYCKRPYIILAYNKNKKKNNELGWIVLNYAKSTDDGTSEIQAMPYVRLKYRRYHIGMNLFKRARKIATQRKKKLVVFHHTRGSDTFYEKCGETFRTRVNF